MMVRHVKADVSTIPSPRYQQTYLTMSNEERKSYNAMVALIQSNIVTTEHDYVRKNGTHLDSVLNTKNKKYLADMLLNVRIAACGGGRAKLCLRATNHRLLNCLQHLHRMHFKPAELSNLDATTVFTEEAMPEKADVTSTESYNVDVVESVAPIATSRNEIILACSTTSDNSQMVFNAQVIILCHCYVLY